MARYLIFVNAALAILAAMMAVGVGVSALLLAWNLELAPRYRDDLFNLVKLTFVYSLVLATSLAAGIALMRRRHWPLAAHAGLQFLFAVSLLLAWQFSIFLLSNS